MLRYIINVGQWHGVAHVSMWIADRNTTTQPGLATCSRSGEISAQCRQCTPAHWHGDKVRPGRGCRVLWGMLTLRSTQLLMLVFRASSPAAAAFIQNFKLYLRVTNDNKVILVCEAPGGFRWQWMKTKSVWLGLLMFLIIFNNVIKWQIENLLSIFICYWKIFWERH